MEPFRVFRQFRSKADAMAYRHEHGTGGWIFVPEAEGQIILFPPDMTPTEIFGHRLTRGLSGELVGCQ